VPKEDGIDLGFPCTYICSFVC